MKLTWFHAYNFTILFRVFLALTSWGYIHPDEYHQSLEIFHGSTRSWEWQQNNALRSKFITELLSKSLLESNVLLGNRIWLLLVVSLSTDLCVGQFIFEFYYSRRYRLMTLFSLCWPTLVFSYRPFSNNLETNLLSMFTLVFLRSHWCLPKWIYSSVFAGILCACGVFNRFTFVFFAAPSVLAIFFRDSTLTINQIGLRMAFFSAAFIFLGLSIIFDDSKFFGKFTIAPLNNFLYNMKTDNVAEHGLHPRVTHVLVNFPMLFLPLLLNLKLAPTTPTTPTATALKWTVILPLICLSLSPHQEPRFILPLLTPLFLLAAEKLSKCGTPMTIFFVIFNLVLTFFFGVAHQGGVIPSLTWLSSKENYQAVYWRTYMVPTFVATNVSDFSGESEHHLFGRLRELKCEQKIENLYLVAPASVPLPPNLSLDNDCTIEARFFHLSTEDLAKSFDELHLNVYSIISSSFCLA